MPPPFKKYKTGRVSYGPAFFAALENFNFPIINIQEYLPDPSHITELAKTADIISISSEGLCGEEISGAGEISKSEYSGWAKGILQGKKWRYDPDK